MFSLYLRKIGYFEELSQGWLERIGGKLSVYRLSTTSYASRRAGELIYELLWLVVIVKD